MNVDIGSEAVFRPTLALLFYQHVSDKGAPGDQFVLIEHDAYVKDGKVRLGEGRQASEQAIADIVQKMALAARIKARVLHPRVLVDVPGLFAWWMPAGRRIHYFDVDNFNVEDVSEARQALRGRKAKLPHPALLFVQRGVGRPNTYVYALRKSQRPEGSTEVFKAPMLNVNWDGWICWGSTPLPATAIQESFQQYEEAFFASTFSHLNQQNMVSAGASMYEWLAGMCNAPPDEFPVEVLKSHGTLDAAISHLAQGALA